MKCATCGNDAQRLYVSALSGTTCKPDADGRALTEAAPINECGECFKKSYAQTYPDAQISDAALGLTPVGEVEVIERPAVHASQPTAEVE